MYPGNINNKPALHFSPVLVKVELLVDGQVLNTSRMKQNKFSVLGLPKEYSENATIHGISYVFSASNAIEKFIWCVIITIIKKLTSLWQDCSYSWGPWWHHLRCYAGLWAVAGQTCGHQPQGGCGCDFSSKHKANTTELHPKVRQTCLIYFRQEKLNDFVFHII